MKSDLGGIVLAGGRGSRFGRPKADVVLGGRSLVARALDALAPHCATLVVVARPETPLPSDFSGRVIFDRPGPAAAIGAIATGMAWLPTTDTLVLACDLVVDPDVLAGLAALGPGTAAAVRDDHGVQPLCARYPRLLALSACERLVDDGDLRARRLVDLVGATAIDVAAGSCRNINTMADATGLFEPPQDEPALADA